MAAQHVGGRDRLRVQRLKHGEEARAQPVLKPFHEARHLPQPQPIGEALGPDLVAADVGRVRVVREPARLRHLLGLRHHPCTLARREHRRVGDGDRAFATLIVGASGAVVRPRARRETREAHAIRIIRRLVTFARPRHRRSGGGRLGQGPSAPHLPKRRLEHFAVLLAQVGQARLHDHPRLSVLLNLRCACCQLKPTLRVSRRFRLLGTVAGEGLAEADELLHGWRKRLRYRSAEATRLRRRLFRLRSFCLALRFGHHAHSRPPGGLLSPCTASGCERHPCNCNVYLKREQQQTATHLVTEKWHGGLLTAGYETSKHSTTHCMQLSTTPPLRPSQI